jgi:hypothetical protein
VPDAGADDGNHADREAGAARTRLAVLQGRAAEAYAAITAADAELRDLAACRVAAEGMLRDAAARHHEASRAVTAHQRARPGPLAQLVTWFRAGRKWRERQAALTAAVADTELPLTAMRRVLSQVKAEFATQVQARAEPVNELRRLTAECAATRKEIGEDRERRDDLFLAEPAGGDSGAADG